MTALEFSTPSCKTVLEKYMWSPRLEQNNLRRDEQKKLKTCDLMNSQILKKRL